MASSSKRPRTATNPSIAYRQFHRFSQLYEVFVRFFSFEILQERFVKWSDFSNYEVSNLFESTG